MTARPAAARWGAAPHRPAAAAVFAGRTAQRLRIALVVDRTRGAITALRLSLRYACTHQGTLRLHAVILRPDAAWGLVARVPSSAIGFSDWAGGSDGHDFHVSGLMSADAGVITGTVHSLLHSTGRRGRCDSGRLTFRAVLGSAPPDLPVPAAITRHQYATLAAGTALAAAQRMLGAADDRDRFRPGDVITETVPSSAGRSWLRYRWRGHPGRYFEFSFRRGRLEAGETGRSID